MKSLLAAALLATTAIVAHEAIAAERTVILSVPGMFCASCPYIVRSAISAVDGVNAVETSLAERTATVTFDDAVTSIDIVTKATADVGYESSPVESGNPS